MTHPESLPDRTMEQSSYYELEPGESASLRLESQYAETEIGFGELDSRFQVIPDAEGGFYVTNTISGESPALVTLTAEKDANHAHLDSTDKRVFSAATGMPMEDCPDVTAEKNGEVTITARGGAIRVDILDLTEELEEAA